MTKLVLSKRLQAIADMVTEGNRLADVGTDHGFLPISLCLEEKIPSAIAMDLRTGPLSRAEEHIREYALSDMIETRLSNGVEKLQPGETDTLTISGMGGMLIANILQAHPDVTASVKELVLGPQSELSELRRILTEELHFYIDREDMVCEDGKYYPIIHAARQKSHVLTDVELAFGPCLLRDRNEVLKSYLLWQKKVQEEILMKLDQAGTETALERKNKIKEELRLIDAALKRYEYEM